MDLGFFGLTSETAAQFRARLFIQIHEIVFHGKGGYDWATVYNMPIWLRQFTFNKINEWYLKEAEAHEKASSKSNGNKSTLIDPLGNVNKQAFKEASPLTPGPKIKYK